MNDVAGALAGAVTDGGETVLELSRRRRVMLVFLRHFGCTFCREAVAEVGKVREEIEAAGAEVVFVYMPGHGVDAGEAERAKGEAKSRAFFERYGLGDVRRVADPGKALYSAFGLGRGSLGQLFGPRVWGRGFSAGVLKGHLVGKLVGDGFQMPGVFVIEDGEVVAGYRHEHAGSEVDYCGLAGAGCDGARTTA